MGQNSALSIFCLVKFSLKFSGGPEQAHGVLLGTVAHQREVRVQQNFKLVPIFLGVLNIFCLVKFSLKCSGGPEQAHGVLLGPVADQPEVGEQWDLDPVPHFQGC
jgi:hypothetical protein